MKTEARSQLEDILLQPPKGSVARQVYAIMRPRNIGYVALRQQVDSLVLHQAELDRAVRGKSSMFHNCYYSAKGLFYQLLFGERQLAVEELFDLQLDNIFSLNFNLCSITEESRRELDSLRGYYNHRHKELRHFVDLAGNTSLEGKTKLYHKLNHELSSRGRKDKEFFDLELKARELKREIVESLHRYTLANDSILDLGEELRFLGVVEDLLQSSIHLSEGIAVKSKRIERHISATKQAYTLVKAQESAVKALDTAVTTLTRFTLGMHNILAEGLSEMSGIIASSKGFEFYPTAIGNLGTFVSSVSEASLLRSQDVEAAVQRYLSR